MERDIPLTFKLHWRLIAVLILVSIAFSLILDEGYSPTLTLCSRVLESRCSFNQSPEDINVNGFNPSSWFHCNLPFEESSYTKDLFFYIHYNKAAISTILPKKFNLSADDCIEEIYVNGNLVFYESDCSGCIHCNGLEVDLEQYMKPGDNYITVKVLNLGGKEMLSVEVTNANPLFGLLDSYNPYWLPYLLIFIGFLIGRRYINNTGYAIFIILVIAVTFSSPLLKNMNYWGVLDWDQHQLYSAVPRDTLLAYHQIPLWNPYYCGGLELLANPQVRVLDPIVLLSLPFDLMHGIKIQIILYAILGMTGCYLLSRHLRIDGFSAYVPPIIFMMSGFYSQHIAAGHSQFLVMAWIPWVYLCYLKSMEDLRYTIAAAVFLALILFGGIYILAYTLILLLAHSLSQTISLKERSIRFRPLAIAISIILLSFMLSSIKLVPILELYQSLAPFIQGRLSESTAGFNIPILEHSILNRGQFIYGPDYSIPGQTYLWHEYGAYVGVLSLILALIGIILSLRESKSIIFIGLLFLVLSMGSYFMLDFWGVLHHTPLFNAIRIPPRNIVMVVFTLALLAGFWLNKIEKKLKILAPIVLFLLLLDITSPNTEILSTAFTIKPEDITTEMSFKQVTDTGQHPGRWSGMYPQYLTNHGTINCYEALMPKVKAIPADSQYYRGEAFIANYSGSASITYFSPNKVIVKVNATENDKVVINQNYIQGWRASEGTVQEYNGLISTDITPQTQEVVFSYLPTGFLLGVVASAVGLLLCVLFLLCIQRKIKT